MNFKNAVFLGIVLGLLGLGNLSALEPRETVFILRPQPSDGAKGLYLKLADYFKTQGSQPISDSFKARAEGNSFGSAFSVKIDGRQVIVTNRHVVGDAEKAFLEVEGREGNRRTIPELKVLYVDNYLDLAFLEVPQGENLPVLNLAAAAPADGAEVWSAGFPSLMNRPSWQLSQGTVTNNRVVVPELGTKEGAVYIQHSASIDPGNSGGPLVSGNPGKSETWQVWGINTWSATGRSNTFFAVPGREIRTAWNRYLKSMEQAPTPAAAVEEFRSFLGSSGFSDHGYRLFMGDAYAQKEGWEILLNALRTMSSADREMWLSSFVVFPVDTLKRYLSYRLWDSYKKLGEQPKTDELTSDSNHWTLSLGNTNSPMKIYWAVEKGRWSISGADVGQSKPQTPQIPKDELVFGTGPSGVGLVLSYTAVDDGPATENPLGAGLEFDWMAFDQAPTITLGFKMGFRYNLQGYEMPNSYYLMGPEWLNEDELYVGFGIRQYFPQGNSERIAYLFPYLGVSVQAAMIPGLLMGGNDPNNSGGSLYLVPQAGIIWKTNDVSGFTFGLEAPLSEKNGGRFSLQGIFSWRLIIN